MHIICIYIFVMYILHINNNLRDFESNRELTWSFDFFHEDCFLVVAKQCQL